MLVPNLRETVQKATSGESVRIPETAPVQNKRYIDVNTQKVLKHAITFKLRTLTGM